MRIAVCMKQVPAYSEGNMDEKTGLIIRSGLPTVVNSYDMSALEAALQIREQTAAVIDIFTMGPKKAEQVLRDAYACGADNGFLVTDRAFGGADVLATSYTLMQAIKTQPEYDLILCGKQTTDGDTAQVSGALAKWLDIPHFTGVTDMVEVRSDALTFVQAFENLSMTLRMEYPCLLAVMPDNYTPRMPSLKLKMAGKKKSITVIGLADLDDKDPSHYGLKGSATKVKKIFPPQRTRQQEIAFLDGKGAATSILQNINSSLDVEGEQ